MTQRVPALLLAALLLAAAAPAQTPADAEADDGRPRIGLVLGGGGARGGAHIGVLKVLHEMRVPVDYVAGTSMGAIVGALFCIGLTPDQIEAEMAVVDWSNIFSDTPQREQRSYRRKQDDSAYFLPLEFGIRGRSLVTARGMIAGQKFAFAFRNPDLYLAGHHGFDDLAYPFRPVATDLRTGEMVILERGNLLKAVRASMSIPGAFPPVEWNGRELVDGYLACNLPVDVVRAMGADIVIAVDVGALPDSTSDENMRTLLGIATQTGLIQARQNVLPQLERADVVIRPHLPGVAVQDFHDMTATFPPGAEAARAAAGQLRPLALDPAAYARHLARHTMPAPGAITVDHIAVKNDSRVADRTIRKSVRQQEGQFLDLDGLEQDLADIYDFGVFELVDFQLSRDAQAGHDSTTLTVIAKRKFYAPNVVYFGLAYEGGKVGLSALNARIRVTSLEINGWGGEVRTDLQLGETDALRAEYYQPLGWHRRPFVATSVTLQSRAHEWYYEMWNLGEYLQKDFHGEVDLGWRLAHFGEVRAGLLFGYVDAATKIGVSGADFEGHRGGGVLQVGVDVMDAAVFPRTGVSGLARAYLSVPDLGSDLDYNTIEAGLRTAGSRGRNTFTAAVQGGSNLGTDLPEFAMFTAGGLGRLSAYNNDQLRGQVYGLAGLGWQYRLGSPNSPYSTQWYTGLSLEVGNAWYDPDAAGIDDLLGSAAVMLGARTLLGPLVLSYARALDGNDALYLTLGRLYDTFF